MCVLISQDILTSEIRAICHTLVRVARIDLVMTFDCDYPWYCTSDYVIVK